MSDLARTHSFARFLKLVLPFLGLSSVYFFFFVAAPDSFHSIYNSKTILTQTVIVGIGAMGMTFVIISGGIDLSVGSLVALGTVVAALVLRSFGDDSIGMVLPVVAAIAGVAVCALFGCINGLIISFGGIVPFIVTLGVMQIARGTAKGLADQTTVLTNENWLYELMVIEPQAGVWYSVAPGVWIALVLAVFMFVLLKFTRFGRYVYAIGSNEQTARLCGINVSLMRVGVYTICGALTGIAGIFQYANLTLGDPTAAVGMELDIIAAVVIGGGSLRGGEGGIRGSLVGALIMAVLRNGCNMVGIPNFVQNIVIGTVIILAVGIDNLKHRANT